MKESIQPCARRPRAFTLIEILAVIAIVAILATLTFPVLSRMRVSSLQTKGLSNIRQLHAMTMSYCSDNDGRLPLGGGIDAGSRNALSWVKDRALGVFFDGHAAVISRAEYEQAYQSP